VWEVLRLALAELKKQYERDIAKMERNFRYTKFNRKWHADQMRRELARINAMIEILEYRGDIRATPAVLGEPEEETSI
jgi:hypothetical protein